jgi:hypothetical protein
MVRDLADAITQEDPRALQRTVSSTLWLCAQVAVPLTGLVALLALAAANGFFDTSDSMPGLDKALCALIVAEGVQALVRLMTAPFVQTLYASQRVGLDNLLVVVARATHAISAVIVFGWLLEGSSLVVQLFGFAAARASLQLLDVALGVRWTRRLFPGLVWTFRQKTVEDYRRVRSTIWHSAQVNVLLNIAPMALAVLINLFFGLSYNTLWQIAVQFTGYAWMMAEGLLRGLSPLATQLQRQGRRRASIDLLLRSIRYQWAVVLPTTLFLGIFAPPLLDLWVGGRLGSDAALATTGITVAQALRLTAMMCWILLASRASRAGFHGVESMLYGVGEIESYSWFAKWALVLALTLTVFGFWLFGEILWAPIGLLVSGAMFSPGVVLSATRRTLGLSYSDLVLHPLIRPLAASLLVLPLLIAGRVSTDLVATGLWLAISGVSYAVVTWFWTLSPDERTRLQSGLTLAIANRGLPR